ALPAARPTAANLRHPLGLHRLLAVPHRLDRGRRGGGGVVPRPRARRVGRGRARAGLRTLPPPLSRAPLLEAEAAPGRARGGRRLAGAAPLRGRLLAGAPGAPPRGRRAALARPRRLRRRRRGGARLRRVALPRPSPRARRRCPLGGGSGVHDPMSTRHGPPIPQEDDRPGGRGIALVIGAAVLVSVGLAVLASVVLHSRIVESRWRTLPAAAAVGEVNQ